MGVYINPVNQTKESFLKANGEFVASGAKWPAAEGKVWVRWVDNGPFTAAAVAFSQREFDEFNRPDVRLMEWWLLDKTAVLGDDSGLDENDKRILRNGGFR